MKYYLIDAFTREPFKGNGAIVCFLDNDSRPDSWMQHVAFEMNLSETAFLLRKGEAYRLRWFTPATEVSLCGHATLASAHALWEEELLAPDQPAVFETRSGRLTATKKADWIEMKFPVLETHEIEVPKGIAAALGVTPTCGSVYQHEQSRVYLLELASEEEVLEVTPDFRALLSEDAKVVMITSRSSTAAYDYVVRFFAPALGIDEDPATGSAQCYLAPYWSKKLGRTELTAYQASRRTGVLRCRLGDSHVYISGQACTIGSGEIIV